MKSLSLFTFLLLTTTTFFAQELDSIVNIGIRLHDQGQYESAIEVYKQALAIDPNSDLANYEIAMTLMSIGKLEEAIQHSEIVINQNSPFTHQAIVIKASSLDDLGKTDESIKLFESAIKKYGNDQMLCFNLGITYYRVGEIEKAIETLQKGILSDPSHASSHLMLGLILEEQNLTVPSLFCLHFFLLLEPDSERSINAVNMINAAFGQGVSSNGENGIVINIDSDFDKKSEWHSAEIMLPMLGALNLTAELEKTSDIEKFKSNNSSIFRILEESRKKKYEGIYWDFYLPFFHSLSASEHFNTYCKYAMMSTNEDAGTWTTNNPAAVESFAVWVGQELSKKED
jgi:tetratricopeptide (TPR) repeat protein